MSRVVLPDPLYRGMSNEVDPQAMRRIVAELSVQLSRMQNQIDQLTRLTGVATSITEVPAFIGQTAVDAGAIYVAAGLTPADWVLVS